MLSANNVFKACDVIFAASFLQRNFDSQTTQLSLQTAIKVLNCVGFFLMLLFLATMHGHVHFRSFPTKAHMVNALLRHFFYDIILTSPYFVMCHYRMCGCITYNHYKKCCEAADMDSSCTGLLTKEPSVLLSSGVSHAFSRISALHQGLLSYLLLWKGP